MSVRDEILNKPGREIAMTHDELVESLGDAYAKIIDAGFVLVPRWWREAALKAAMKSTEERTLKDEQNFSEAMRKFK